MGILVMLLTQLNQNQMLMSEGHQFSLYQTVSKAYVFDKAGIDIGNNPGDDGE